MVFGESKTESLVYLSIDFQHIRFVAFDIFGVESDSPILEGTSPNLPPKLPQGVEKEYNDALNLGFDWYEVTITWEKLMMF